METYINTRGFTLIEILIVVAIVGILAAIAVPSYYHVINRAKLTSSISAVEGIRTEIEAYFTVYEAYPSDIDFSDFTDIPTGQPVLVNMNWDRVKDKLYSWGPYTNLGNSYTLKARAMDANHTELTLSTNGITY